MFDKTIQTELFLNTIDTWTNVTPSQYLDENSLIW